MDKDNILQAIEQAFGTHDRPPTMVRNPTHCEECADHEAVMQAVTPDTVSFAEIGNPGWDPVCYLTDEAFGYFMPGFARLALEGDYLYALFFHLDQGERVESLNAEQRCAVSQLMDYVGETRLDEITMNFYLDAFGRIMDSLADACP